jgi:uncharacterized membrane protein YkvA (DUF1232 family)
MTKRIHFRAANSRASDYRSAFGKWSLRALLADLGNTWRLLWDPAVPALLKLALPLLALIYWIYPFDLIPFLPIDDIAVVLLLARIFVNVAPLTRGFGAETRTPPSAKENDDPNFIETTWRVIDEPPTKTDR